MPKTIELPHMTITLSNENLYEQCLSLIDLYKANQWGINHSGFTRRVEEAFDKKEVLESIPLIRKCMALIPLIVETTKSRALVGSYGLKHRLEKLVIENYISNGVAILAMLLLGHRARLPQTIDSPNCEFFCKYAKNDYMNNRGTAGVKGGRLLYQI